MKSRVSFQNLDFGLIVAVLILVIFGLVAIASATHFQISGTDEEIRFLRRQGSFLLGSIIMVWLSLRFDYRRLKDIYPVFYGLTLLALVLVLLIGESALGAQRWLQIGSVSIQPSELSKLFLIITLAAFISNRMKKIDEWYSMIPVFILILIPAFLVMRQPDLGTALVFFAILAGMVFVAGIPWKYIGVFSGLLLVLIPVSWPFLHDYQKSRILVLINPNEDPLGAGYHVIQSQIAIGSGQFFGKGLFSGSQSQLNFLPENHTDFIFSVIGEELGFAGCILVLVVYGYLIFKSLKIADEAQDDFGLLLGVGIAAMWTFQLFVNLGMTLGIMPVTGIPLPFISYGVSSLSTNLMAVAILLNIHVWRKRISF